jgi:hypothetical protein
MGKRDFAGRHVRAAADHCRVAQGVVRCSKGPRPDEVYERPRSRDRGDDRGHSCFVVVQRRQHSGHCACQKRLTRAGWADHYDAVTAGERQFHGAAGFQLTPNLGQVWARFGHESAV